jgi:hypothetical protein
MDFTKYPRYNPYRVLVDRVPMMIGCDVYALQLGINAILGTSLKSDGTLGPKTGAQIWNVQHRLGETEDGKAGMLTQRALALEVTALNNPGTVPAELVYGQLEHESSFILGNYSAKRPNSSYDAGVCQMNTEHHPADEAFNPAQAIPYLIAHTKNAYDAFHDKSLFRGDDHSDKRRWILAAGAWNAPAFAHYLAGVKPWAVPGATALELFNEYLADVSIYL